MSQARSWDEAVRLTQVRECGNERGKRTNRLSCSCLAATLYPPQAEKVVNAAPHPRDVLSANAAGAITRRKGFGRTTVFDPVRGVLADPRAEAAAASARAAAAVARGNRARDWQLNHEQAFSIFTGRPLAAEPEPRPRRAATDSEGGRVPFNIVTAQPLPNALVTARAARASEALRAQAIPARPLVSHAPSLVRRRAIDIVTNRYRVDDEAKSRAEADKVAERATRRFWQTRNFNPVTQAYEDAAKDAAYDESLRASQAVQGVSQAERLPACLRYSLGRAYDIVAHEPRDAPVVELLDAMANRPLRRMTRPHSEAGMVARGEAAADLAQSRRLASQARIRHVDLSDPHAFDSITATPTDAGRMEHMLAGGSRRAPATAWSRIEHVLEGGGGGGGGGDGGVLGGWGAASGRQLSSSGAMQAFSGAQY